ncbi:hypothetical protein BJ912DRAFT_1068778 [Pholiota molesta]|nr:hypothetical protein BJ912DRAFT_1068778 [Pholiota molesta]
MAIADASNTDSNPLLHTTACHVPLPPSRMWAGARQLPLEQHATMRTAASHQPARAMSPPADDERERAAHTPRHHWPTMTANRRGRVAEGEGGPQRAREAPRCNSTQVRAPPLPVHHTNPPPQCHVTTLLTSTSTATLWRHSSVKATTGARWGWAPGGFISNDGPPSSPPIVVSVSAHHNTLCVSLVSAPAAAVARRQFSIATGRAWAQRQHAEPTPACVSVRRRAGLLVRRHAQDLHHHKTISTYEEACNMQGSEVERHNLMALGGHL